MKPVADIQYLEFPKGISEKEHLYGKNIHLLSDIYAHSLLNTLSAPETVQPRVNEIVRELIWLQMVHVLKNSFPTNRTVAKTRMLAESEHGALETLELKKDTDATCVALARAGITTSEKCFSILSAMLQPERVRQDHIFISRTVDDKDQVTGSAITGHKIGGRIDDHILLIPDPMGATGSTLAKVLDFYDNYGKPSKVICMHLVITPEYVRKVQELGRDIEVFTFRIDRGLSPEKLLGQIPGKELAAETGLNEHQYIIPGCGGVGELMNNSQA